MTQRFGGIFSVLNRREIAQLSAARDWARDLDEIKFGNEPLDGLSVRDLIDLSKDAKDAIEESVFGDFEYREPRIGYGSHKEGFEAKGQLYFSNIVTPSRGYIITLGKIIKKLERVQRKFETKELR